MHYRTLALLFLIAGCSGSPPEPKDTDEGDSTVDDDDIAPIKRDASAQGMRDASTLDARRPGAGSTPDCTPGHYEGEFNCVISDLLPWFGKIQFDLVEQAMNSGEFTSLTIVPGTKIMGSDDSLSGMFTADLQGDFDCRTGKLTGQIANGVYLFAGFMEYMLAGPLQGDYRRDGGPSGFDGTMGKLTSANFEAFGELGPSAMCTWSANQVGPVVGDAGR